MPVECSNFSLEFSRIGVCCAGQRELPRCCLIFLSRVKDRYRINDAGGPVGILSRNGHSNGRLVAALVFLYRDNFA